MKTVIILLFFFSLARVSGAQAVYNFTPCRNAEQARARMENELREITAADARAIRDMRAGREPGLEKIESLYRDFIRRYPENSEARNYLGGFYYDTGRAGEAYRQWLTGLRVNPRDAFLYNNLSEYYAHDTGQPRRAIELVRRAIALRGDVAVFHLNLATYYDVFRYTVLDDYDGPDGVFREVLAAYRRAIELEPDNFGHAFDYARTLTYSPAMWRIKDPTPLPDKIDAWRRCLELAPDDNAVSLAREQIERLEAKKVPD